MKTFLNPETKELRRLSGIYLLEGLVIAGMFHCAMIGGVNALMQHFNVEVKIPRIILDEPIVWIPIGERENPGTTKPGILPPVPFVNNALPNIIPELDDETVDTVKNTEQTVSDLSGSEPGGSYTSHTILSGTFVPGESEEREPEPFTIVEKEPVPILYPSPRYPELARKAGVEGSVFVKMWVTKEGSVKKAVVLKSDSPIFDQEAVAAALQWKFSPAIMNSSPVSVWVTVPFKFRLTAQ